MSRQVFALALDAVPPALLEEWLAAGTMPNLARLRERGAFGRLRKDDEHPHEASWSAFLQGCPPQASGLWGHHRYDPRSYAVEEAPAYRLERYPPFYALLGDRRALIMDMPHAPVLPSLRGVHLQGWGVESNVLKASSLPAPLFADVARRHGPHPVFGGADARVIAVEGDGTVAGFRLPSVYDAAALRELEARLAQAAAQRAAILLELMSRNRWDILLTAYGELHLGMHTLWHECRPHPLAPALGAPGSTGDSLSRLARAVDESLGGLLEALPPDACVAIYSVFGMAANAIDLPVNLFLPELLYRLQFGEPALAAGDPSAPPPPPATHYRKHWKDEVWALRTPRGGRDLESPDAQGARNDSMDWCPLNWYRPQWPRMRAFALPSFSHGMVRMNVRDREGAGVLEARDYDRACDEIAVAIRGLASARSGRPIVRSVTRTRRNAHETGPHLPAADLLVTWDEAEPADVVDSPLVGRIGPVPWLRTGGHIPDGFCLLSGPGIAPGALPVDATIPDLTATLLEMLGVEIPAYVEGKSLLVAA